MEGSNPQHADANAGKLTPGKGEEGGECAREACDRRPAVCFNRGTRKYYCAPCARKINEYNPGCCVAADHSPPTETAIGN